MYIWCVFFLCPLVYHLFLVKVEIDLEDTVYGGVYSEEFFASGDLNALAKIGRAPVGTPVRGGDGGWGLGLQRPPCLTTTFGGIILYRAAGRGLKFYVP